MPGPDVEDNRILPVKALFLAKLAVVNTWHASHMDMSSLRFTLAGLATFQTASSGMRYLLAHNERAQLDVALG